MIWLAVWSAIERHADHANKDTIRKVIQYGIPVYSCEETREIDKRIINIKKGRKTSIGGFKIQPIPLHHSCECFGFLIEHNDFGRLVFATDCCEFPYNIKDINHWLIEANYSEDCLIDNFCNNEEMRSRHEYHLEFGDTLNVLERNYCPYLQTIVLLHLSNGNSNEEMFKSRISEDLGFFNVFIANKGLKIELNKEDF